MDPRLFPSEGRPLQPSGQSWLGFNGVCVTSLLIPPGRVRIALTMPALLYFATRARMYSSGLNAEDYMTAVNITIQASKWIDFVLLGTPERDVRRVDMTKQDKPMQDENVENMTMWQKLRWSLSFWTNWRGIGWNWQVKNVDDVPLEMTRRYVWSCAFLSRTLFSLVKCYLAIDLLQHYIFTTPYSQTTNTLTLFNDSLIQQVCLGWVAALRSGFGLSSMYHLSAIIAVGLRLSTPQEWPGPFGSFTEGYTMRKIWGYCWHQYLRRPFTTATSLVTSGLGVPKGSLSSRYIQLYGAFIVSTIIHHAGALNVPYSPVAWYQIFFFMIQPVAITVEDAVIHVGKRVGFQKNSRTKAIGFLWVFAFLSYSLRYMAALEALTGGAAVRHPFIWSIADRVL